MKDIRRMTSPYFVWALIFVLIPLFMTFYYAFTLDGSLSLANFQRFFSSGALPTLFRSLRVAVLTSIICLVLAYPMAYFLAGIKGNYRSVAITLVIIPMWMNFLLRTYSWTTILSRRGIVSGIFMSMGLKPLDILYSEAAVVIGMVYNFLPFMILPIYTSLEKIDQSLIEAARDLGADNFQTFTRVLLPLSFPGIASGISMVFIPAISTFEITTLLGGNKTNLIGNVIEQQFTVTGNWNYGFAMSIILMVFLLVSLIFSNEDKDDGAKSKKKKAAMKEGAK